jgi:hypothetical protein
MLVRILPLGAAPLQHTPQTAETHSTMQLKPYKTRHCASADAAGVLLRAAVALPPPVIPVRMLPLGAALYKTATTHSTQCKHKLSTPHLTQQTHST